MPNVIRSNAVQGDVNASGMGMVVDWDIGTTSVEDALNAPGVPKRGDAHPDYADLVCDRLAHTCNGAITTVTAYYSNDGRFATGATRLERQQGWFKWSPAMGKPGQVDIPYSTLRQKRIVGIGPNGEDTSRDALEWMPEILHAPRVKEFRRLEVYTQLPDREVLSTVINYMGHMHYIRGQWLQFLGLVDYTEDAGNWFKLKYDWWGDGGTPWPEPRTTERTVFLGPDNRPADDRYIRLPFEELKHTSTPDAENVPIAVVGVRALEWFRDEWRQLPGMVPL